MTDEELKEIVASIAVEHRELVVAQKETDRQLKAQAVEAEHDRREMKKSNRELHEAANAEKQPHPQQQLLNHSVQPHTHSFH